MPNYDWKLNIRDTHVTLTYNLKDTLGAAVDLTLATAVDWVVTFEGKQRSQKEMTVSDASNGIVTVQPDAGMLYEGLNEIHVYVDWDAAGDDSWSTTAHYILGDR